MNSLAKCAEWYAKQGFHIFPCWPGTKKPATKHGYKDAAPNADRWTRRPDLNIAISCIASRVVLIDEDVPGAVAAQGWTMPRTWTSIGRRGPGLWYRVPDGFEPSLPKVAGIDIKWRGYGLVPPSIHPETSQPYRWIVSPREAELAIAPTWMIGLESGYYDDDGPLTGEAHASFLGVAFAAAGWLGPDLGGRSIVRCPWADEHTDGRGLGEDASTVLFPSRPNEMRIGRFFCAHSHCRGRRLGHVVDALPQSALEAAARVYRDELDAVRRILKRTA